MFCVILDRGKLVMIEVKAQFKLLCCGFKHPQAFGYYFFTDPVTGYYCDIESV